jgi:hypothetical protein
VINLTCLCGRTWLLCFIQAMLVSKGSYMLLQCIWDCTYEEGFLCVTSHTLYLCRKFSKVLLRCMYIIIILVMKEFLELRTGYVSTESLSYFTPVVIVLVWICLRYVAPYTLVLAACTLHWSVCSEYRTSKGRNLFHITYAESGTNSSSFHNRFEFHRWRLHDSKR